LPKWVAAVAAFVVLLVVGAGVALLLGRSMENATVQAPAEPPPEAASRLPPPPPGSEWRYTTPQAYAGGATGAEACTRAGADVDIAGGGQSTVRLCLRRGGGYPFTAQLVLGDMHGAFACADCQVGVTFDQRRAEDFAATASSTDGTAYTLFLKDPDRLAAELKRASAATFSVQLRGAGAQAVAFDVAGLKWP
jgi:hypothetical protein